MKTLRDRCREFNDQLQRNGILRQGNPVEDLMAFVNSEKGRDADDGLEGTSPLVLYFGTEEDREEFVRAVLCAKPDMITKRMP